MTWSAALKITAAIFRVLNFSEFCKLCCRQPTHFTESEKILSAKLIYLSWWVFNTAQNYFKINRGSGEGWHWSEQRFNPAANTPIGEEVDSRATCGEVKLNYMDASFFGGLWNPECVAQNESWTPRVHRKSRVSRMGDIRHTRERDSHRAGTHTLQFTNQLVTRKIFWRNVLGITQKFLKCQIQEAQKFNIDHHGWCYT